MDDTGGLYAARENLWDQQWPQTGEGSEHAGLDPDDIDEFAGFPDVAGTSDPIEAVRDAEPYVPPMDPPVLPGGREGIHTATGFGLSTEESATHDEMHGDEDIHDEAIRTLRQDSLTSHYNLDVTVRNGTIVLRGQVPSIDDAEHALSILSVLPDVVDVEDETTLLPAGVEDTARGM